jgi:hypothetical protein
LNLLRKNVKTSQEQIQISQMIMKTLRKPKKNREYGDPERSPRPAAGVLGVGTNRAFRRIVS